MAGSVSRYAFINAKLRARISKMLEPEFISTLIRSPSLNEAIQQLQGTPFAALVDIYTKTGDLKLAELELLKKEISLYRDIKNHVADDVQQVVTAMLLRFEVENLKNTLRLWFESALRQGPIIDTSVYLLRQNILNDIKIDSILSAKTPEDLIDSLKGTPYAPIISLQIPWMLENKSVFRMEIALDHYFYDELWNAIEKLPPRDLDIAHRIFSVEIDVQNINRLIRFKNSYDFSFEELSRYLITKGSKIKGPLLSKAFSQKDAGEMLSILLEGSLSGLKTMLGQMSDNQAGQLTLIEKVLSEYLMQQVRQILAGYPFTIGIVMAYFILKRNEIQTLITILNAKYYGLSEERIRSRL
ncbi:MAG: V-type ATPase subunit [Spirochaetales bacterium]|nr:V-type ATPase subunit [Spirochaetales bacterium]